MIFAMEGVFTTLLMFVGYLLAINTKGKLNLKHENCRFQTVAKMSRVLSFNQISSNEINHHASLLTSCLLLASHYCRQFFRQCAQLSSGTTRYTKQCSRTFLHIYCMVARRTCNDIDIFTARPPTNPGPRREDNPFRNANV